MQGWPGRRPVWCTLLASPWGRSRSPTCTPVQDRVRVRLTHSWAQDATALPGKLCVSFGAERTVQHAPFLIQSHGRPQSHAEAGSPGGNARVLGVTGQLLVREYGRGVSRDAHRDKGVVAGVPNQLRPDRREPVVVNCV